MEGWLVPVSGDPGWGKPNEECSLVGLFFTA